MYALKRFLGMVGYYCRTIKGLAKITACLETAMLGLKRKDWNPELQQAFEKTKTALKNAVCLVHPIPGEPIRLTTDASDIGMGAELAQYHEGEWCRISFFSRKLIHKSPKELLDV